MLYFFFGIFCWERSSFRFLKMYKPGALINKVVFHRLAIYFNSSEICPLFSSSADVLELSFTAIVYVCFLND